MKQVLAAIALASSASVAGAETNFANLTQKERAIFHAEIRAVLLSNPDLLDVSASPPSFYEDDIASDLELIQKWSAALFDNTLPGFGSDTADQKIALFIGPNCEGCDRAKTELEALSASFDLRVTLFDRTRHAELADALAVDMLPFYVFPKMMLRGHIPQPVLERYLSNKTGQ